jgi:hypothetical protein
MRFAEPLIRRVRALAVLVVAGLLGSCGGGTTSTTAVICKDAAVCVTQEALQATPTGTNTTEIIVDSGPPGAFSLGVTNVPYVSVTVCSPGSASNCTTIDHVLLDTGSYGLRVLKSKVAGLTLPAIAVAADGASGTPAGNAAECYAFILGAAWGPLAVADVRIGGELAPNLNLQLIDDNQTPTPAVPPNCQTAAQGALLNSVATLQANGILGIGMVGIDCGLTCLTNAYPGSYVVYYSCPTGGTACLPAGLPAASQVQNPVTRFAVNNNGTLIAMPALPELGAMVARGRLVFGIGTQSNNQLPLAAKMYQVNTNAASADYLYVGLQVGAQSYPQSFIDTGSNAMFFDDASLSTVCNVSGGQQGRWYCPASTWRQTATLTDAIGVQGSFNFAVASADTLFNTGATAFADLGGSAGQSTQTFALGLPFFYGRNVFVSIWGQVLSPNGPWYAF